jgi:uncharacterized protein (DUF433 family)
MPGSRPQVTRPDQVALNIRNFTFEVAVSAEMQAKLGLVHAWYALRGSDGQWMFAPSKFVGYPNNTAREYEETYRTAADGRETESALSKWFSPVDTTSRLGVELMEALERFLAQWNRTPRHGARISVVSVGEDGEIEKPFQVDDKLFDRISINPRVAGGRPCIKGTRMRVSDIVDMLAAGASRSEILEDYPYLAEEDITAALAYAARATDHRVIRAA